MRDFKKYHIWEISHQLTVEIYKITSDFPEDEKFRIVSQITRAAACIPVNIAEGCGRDSIKSFLDF